MNRLGLIVSNVPVWVWPLLVVLVIVGWRASRDRTTVIFPLYLLPLLGILSANAVNRMSVEIFVWAVFAAGYLLGLAGGYRFQRSVIIEKSGNKVTLKGEWLTLILMMTIFWMNFLVGVMKATAPEVYTSAGFHAVFAVVAGLVAGSFFGRAARVFTAR